MKPSTNHDVPILDIDTLNPKSFMDHSFLSMNREQKQLGKRERDHKKHYTGKAPKGRAKQSDRFSNWDSFGNISPRKSVWKFFES